MGLKFTKMHGLGNDFAVIDATQEKIILSATQIQQLADRHTGIGFDQLLMIEPATNAGHDFKYRIFNASGKEVEQCGNGARCVARYIFSEQLSPKKKLRLDTIAGTIELQIVEDGNITVNMGAPQFSPAKIPFVTDKEALQYELPVADQNFKFGAVSMGNPHAVSLVADIDQAPVQQIGESLQQHPAFPRQINVGFMQIVSPEYIRLRVYERGVGETRACGSGACAAVVVGRQSYQLAPVVTVELPGGTLKVAWDLGASDVYLTGPAEKVYRGESLLTAPKPTKTN